MDSRGELQKIHFFEMFAQERFAKYLRSALLYTTNIFFERSPILVPYRYYQNYMISGLEFALQAYFMKKSSATYSEYYYGITRFIKGKVNSNINSSFKKYAKALFLTVLLPLIKRHIDNHYLTLKNRNELGEFEEPTKKNKFIKAFLKIYPVMDIVFNLANLGFNMNYLLNPKAKYYNLFYAIAKHSVTRVDQELEEVGEGFIAGFLAFFKRYLVFMLFIITKLFEWYYDENRQKNENLDNFQGATSAPFDAKQNQTYKNRCPLCHKPIKNPCVLDTCGWVFCQSCIYTFIQKAKKCPKTQMQCTVDNIHRIYE